MAFPLIKESSEVMRGAAVEDLNIGSHGVSATQQEVNFLPIRGASGRSNRGKLAIVELVRALLMLMVVGCRGWGIANIGVRIPSLVPPSRRG